MRVVREETILQKIDKEIEKKHPKINRIELTSKEFKNFVLDLTEASLSFSNENIMNGGSDLSGSYIMYEGVCVQTHDSYE